LKPRTISGHGVTPFGRIDQDDYSMHVVGPDNEGVQINAMVMRRQVIPCLLHDRAHFIQSHIAVDDFTQEHDAILRAGGDETCAGLRIIVAWQTQGAAAWMRIVGHLMLACSGGFETAPATPLATARCR
jgi:hypothetical protein